MGSIDLAEESVPSSPAFDPLLDDVDELALEHDLHDAQRWIHRLGPPVAPSTRSDPSHTSVSGWHLPPSDLPNPTSVTTARQPRSSILAWSLLSLGLMALACGGVLLAWSMLAERPDLAILGLPLAAGGLAGLMLGFMLLLDGLWHSHLDQSHVLRDMNEQLWKLRQTTSLLGTSHGSAAQAFYTHLAHGASPDLLLADLKGQLDMLALRLSMERKAS